MAGFSIPEIATIGGIALIVILFMLIGFIKGMVRMFFGLISLVVATATAYWGFKHGDAVTGYMISEPDPWMAGALGAIMGLAVFFTARAIFGMIVKPTKVVDGKKKNGAGFGGLLGIVGGVVFAAFALSGIRYLGTVSELDWIKNCLAEEGKINQLAKPALTKLRDLIDDTPAGQAHRDYDFLNSGTCAQISRLKILTENKYAITVAAGNEKILKAFNQPEIRKLLESTPELAAYVEENKFSHLLASKKVQEVSKVPAAQEVLAPIDLPTALGIEPKPKKKAAKKK